MNPEDRYDSLFKYYGKDLWLLLKAQVKAESAFNKKAISRAGAKGLAQFMERTWEEWNKDENIFDPEESIKAQAKYMRYLLQNFNGNVRLALAAYNFGIGNVKRLVKAHGTEDWFILKNYVPKETREYVERIMNFLEKYLENENMSIRDFEKINVE